ncbi:type IV pilus modification PilV family protein [Chondromyces crocatus]|uniref:Prepilin-type N-terminal cleavage/methylation domain-containing protein n=1 Tax=Chondromyces crocatus TaxID=52 RepID=A0A0K1EEV0_CHOCO|nr:prepilin-type N-terminal cleavage/methylation domain-containing protein [Chondromyces crocatus]AKT39384.1 uncharacterized protein CMC5_035310 [Chondromyces crocatus]
MNTRSPHPSRARRAGYTVIEVMVALGILALGASGIIALQRATAVSGTQARNLAMANLIAQSWAERIRVDALQWNEPNGLPDLSETDWLRLAETNPDQRLIPEEVPTMGSPVADVLGIDAYSADLVTSAYCTHLRFHRFPGIMSTPGTLIRADIRVFWRRDGSPADCDVTPSAVDAQPDLYGAVYLTTSVMRNKIRD